MSAEQASFSIPAHVVGRIESDGYDCPMSQMRESIELWDSTLRCKGRFWDRDVADGKGHTRRVHMMTVRPAKRVCKEFASLVMDGDTKISTESEAATEWLNGTLDDKAFIAKGQELVMRGFALGTAAWALWYDGDAKDIQFRRYDARMVVPLSWDEDAITECAFVTRAQLDGKPVDQLQMHVKRDGTYHIVTCIWDEDGKQVTPDGVEMDFDTNGDVPWFGVFSPAGGNDQVDFSPYGQSVFADAVDIMKSVDIAYDALFGEVRNGKRIIMLSDYMLQVGKDSDGNMQVSAFGPDDSGVYRMVESSDDMVKDFAPALRVDGFASAYKEALKAMGDAVGLGADYFIADKAAGMKTAREVAAGQSALMRNIAKHENQVGAAIKAVCEAALHCAETFMGVQLGDWGHVTVRFDDSIIEDTDSERAQDLLEVNAGIMPKWKYAQKWYGLSEQDAVDLVAQAGSYIETPSFME